MVVDHTTNRTLAILHAAHRAGYAINAQSCYDAQSVVALVRSAEACGSPAICQLFPVTMAQFGKPFVRFCLETCHTASVPIAVHLDHAATHEDITRALDWAEQGVALDSIMIDCSHHDSDQDNIQMAKPYVQRANHLGLAVEVELGRLAGGEAGVRLIEEGMLTKPEKGKPISNPTILQLQAHSHFPSLSLAVWVLAMTSVWCIV